MKFSVIVHCPELSEAVQKLAFRYGYSWHDGHVVQYTDAYSLEFNFITPHIITQTIVEKDYRDKCKVYDATTQWKEIEKQFKSVKMWKIGNYEACMDGEELVVGCVRVHMDTIREINKAFQDKYVPF